MKNDEWKLHLLKLLGSIPADATEIHRFLLQKTTMSRKEAWNVAQAFEDEAIYRDGINTVESLEHSIAKTVLNNI